MAMTELHLSRRQALGGGVAALVTLLCAPPVLAEASRRADTLQSDPRHGLIARLGDLIIPPTQTPGASEPGAVAFVFLALDHHMGEIRPRMLTQVHEALNRQGGGEFLQLPAAQQERLVSALDTQAYAVHDVAEGSLEQAWRGIKCAVVAGYYTSQIGASQELVYDGVPGTFRNFLLTPGYRETSNDGFANGFGGTL